MPEAHEPSSHEDIAPLLRLGLEDNEEHPVEEPPGGSMQRTSGSVRGWEPPSVEQLQRLLPQYEISEFIARGGMGAVYKGRQKTLRRPVAIKVLPPDLEDGDLQFAARFKHEAQAMAQLSHPNIVAVFDAGETLDGLLYFVMEFIEGTDVAQLITTEGHIHPQRAIQITTAVCEALAFAHEEGIIHRDIKPSNIMLDKRGRVKVADFGLAKTVDLEHSLHTRSHMAMGTPDFIAPEALKSGVKVDGRADLYALGVMLYQMLTGHIPRGRFELPSGMVPEVSKGFDAVVDKAMQTDRDKRYSTATEMKTALEKVGSGQPKEGSTKKAEATKPRNCEANTATSLPFAQPNSRNLIIAAAMVVVGVVAFFALKKPVTSAGVEAGTLAGGTGKTVAPRTVAWKRVDFATDERLLGADPDIAREADLLHLKKNRTFTAPGTKVRDGAVRAVLVWSKHAAWTPRVTTRMGAGKQYHLTINYDSADLDFYNGSPTTLKTFRLATPLREGDEVSVQLASIGRRHFAWVNGTLLGSVEDGQLDGAGELGIQANDARFKSMEWLPLDGLPEAEALKLAGIDVPEMKPSDIPASWQAAFGKPLEQLATTSGGRTFQHGWLNVQGGLPDAKIGFDQGMARVRVGWVESTKAVKLGLKDTEIELDLSVSGAAALHRWVSGGIEPGGPILKLPAPLKPGDTFTLRIAWLSGRIYGWIDEQFIGSQPLLPTRSRLSCVWFSNDKSDQQVRLRDYEVLSLNGLSESVALKLAGVSKPTAAPTPKAGEATVHWHDWLAEREKDGTMPPQLVKEPGGWRISAPTAGSGPYARFYASFGGPHLKDAAIRVTCIPPAEGLGKQAYLTVREMADQQGWRVQTKGAEGQWFFTTVKKGMSSELLALKPMREMTNSREPRTVELRMVGDTLSFFYNGIFVGEVHDSTPSTGAVGFNGPPGMLITKVEWADLSSTVSASSPGSKSPAP